MIGGEPVSTGGRKNLVQTPKKVIPFARRLRVS
jgi:hypothetical protein